MRRNAAFAMMLVLLVGVLAAGCRGQGRPEGYVPQAATAPGAAPRSTEDAPAIGVGGYIDHGGGGGGTTPDYATEDGWARRTAAAGLDAGQYPQGPATLAGGSIRLYAAATDRVVIVTGTDGRAWSYSVRRDAHFDLGVEKYPQPQYLLYSILESEPDAYTVDLRAEQGAVTWVRMNRK